MSNVVPLRPRGCQEGRSAASAARETAALVSDLVDVVEKLKAASGRASDLPRPAAEVEQAIQCLLDAVTCVERAAGTLTENGELVPF